MLNPESADATSDEITDTFETNHLFDEEGPAKTIARFEWLSARLRGEFIIYLADLGIAQALAAKLLDGFEEAQADYREFVCEGVDAYSLLPHEEIVHPLEDCIDELTDEVSDSLSDAIPIDELFGDGKPSMLGLGIIAEEDMIHRLAELKTAWGPRQQQT